MSSPIPSPDKGSRVRRLVGETGWTRTRAVLSLGMVFGLGAVGTMAAWSDTATATTGTFTMSSVNVEMKLNSQSPVYNMTSLNKLHMPRGASVAGMLPVNNVGTADFTYRADVITADAGTATYGKADVNKFAEKLTVTVFAGGSSNGATCTGGTQIGSAVQLSIGSKPFIGSARSLAAGQTEPLCIQVALAGDAPLEARMSAVTVDFKFAATAA
ncbi:SipW-dependent-type signal peptide-containing protein [Gordonia alkaliphila]|uniref:Ribosomally synthesized peptide with SipW-like signal peptide n=1 Tax=Gordonia alkaliphila TaxID=1053547 RepID=A0ABP8Z3D3_9ACTN